MAAGLIGVAALTVGLGARRPDARAWGSSALAPLVFVLVPLLQSIPLPFGLRGRCSIGTGRRCSATTSSTPTVGLAAQPRSAEHAGRRRPGRARPGRLPDRLSPGVGPEPAAPGDPRDRRRRRRRRGHRARTSHPRASSELYGFLTPSHRSLLIGPFVNSNHTAEFLELAAFVCLACSFQRPTALNRIGWLIGTLLCAGGAAATLSRGAVLALAMAVADVRVPPLRLDRRRRGRAVAAGSSLAWGALVGGAAGARRGGARCRSAGRRFKTDAVTHRRPAAALAGRAAGPRRAPARDRPRRVRPRLSHLPDGQDCRFALRFAFVENEPLQLLVDCGWLFFLVLGVGGRRSSPGGSCRGPARPDRGGARLTGLVAVAVHSFVDFGLETLGCCCRSRRCCGATLGAAGAGRRVARARPPRSGLSSASPAPG